MSAGIGASKEPCLDLCWQQNGPAPGSLGEARMEKRLGKEKLMKCNWSSLNNSAAIWRLLGQSWRLYLQGRHEFMLDRGSCLADRREQLA